MSDDEKKDIEEAIENLYDAIRIDEGRFETKITYLSAGAIMLVLTFVVAIGSVVRVGFLHSGLILSGASLILNMATYLIGNSWWRGLIKLMNKSIRDDVYPYPDPNARIDEKNKKMDILNVINLSLMVVGVGLLIIFVCINLM